MNKLILPTPVKWILKAIISAALYFLFGQMPRWLGLPLEPFNSLWIPGGAATALLFIFGPASLAGIFAAAWVVNFETLQSYHGELPALAMAALVSLQSLSCVLLVKRFTKKIPPRTMREILLATLMMAVNTGIFALAGMLLLKGFGYYLQTNDLAFFSIWWLEEMITLLLLVPLFTTFYERVRQKNRNESYLWALSALFLGLMLFITYYSWQVEINQTRSKIRTDVENLFSLISNQLREETASVTGIESFFISSEVVENEEFQNFTREYLETLQSTIAYVWVPVVTRYSKEDFEKEASQLTGTAFSIREFDENGQPVKAASRAVYYPVLFYEPETSASTHGIDLGTYPILLETMKQASILDAPIASKPVQFTTEREEKSSVFITVPVYEKVADVPLLPGYKGTLKGYCAGFFDLNIILRNSLQNAGAQDYDVFLIDITDEISPLLIATYFPKGVSAQSDGPVAYNFFSLEEEFTHNKTFDFNGRKWSLIAKPSSKYLAAINPHYSGIVFIFCTVLTGTWFFYLDTRQKNVARLRESEEKFRSLSDNALTGIMQTNRQGQFLYANDALIHLMGFQSFNELRNENFYKVFAIPGDVEKSFKDMASGASIVNLELKVNRQDKVQRHMLLSAGFLEDLISANVIDFTEIMELNKEIRELDHAIQHMVDSVIITDKKGLIEYSNAAAERIFDFPINGLTGKNILDLISISFPSFKIGELLKNLDERNAYEFVFSQNKKDGTSIQEYVTFSPIRGQNQKVNQIVCTGKDISDLKKAEDEIRDLNARLEQKVADRTAALEKANQELESFSYTVSHDLRAPLRGMQAYASLLLEDYGKQIDETGIRYLNQIKSSSEKMDVLIEELLKLSRLGKTRLNREKINLAALAQEIINNLKNEEPERDVRVILPEAMVVRADARLMHIALDNLLRNAWKFTRKKEGAQIEFGSIEQENEKIYFVKDNGAGFEMKYADKLFNIFQRLHKEEDFEGTGIGLVTVKRILDHHGGKVWAEGEAGKGATFFFTLEKR